AGANALKDSHGRVIDYLRISVTDRCNMRCSYCIPEEGVKFIPSDEILRYEEILTLADIFIGKGIKKIRITGGEPLLRNDILFLIERLGTKPIDEIVLTTNGILLGEYAERLKDSGVERVNVSLDSLNKNTYQRITKTDSLPRVIDGIHKANKSGLKVKVNVVAMRGINDSELLDFVNFGKKNNIGLRFIEVMPQYYSEEMVKDLFIGSKEIVSQIEKEYTLTSLKNSQKGSVERLFEIRETDYKFGIINAMSDPFCSHCNRLRLMANGVLKACLFGEDGPNLKKMLGENKKEEEISRAIEKLVMDKPEKYFIDERTTNLVMNRVGG
ncbi:MAG: GTP 3',8-cyclase MoaA, partial [Spirochaetota bacterium]